MLTRFSLLSWVLLFAAGAYGVYMVKYEVEELRQENIALEKSLQHEKNSLAMRRLEWAALNHPARLRRLSEALLPMDAVKAERVVELSAIPMLDQEFAKAEAR